MKDLLDVFKARTDDFTQEFDDAIAKAMSYAEEGDLLMAGEEVRCALSIANEAIDVRNAEDQLNDDELSELIACDIANGGRYHNPLDC